MRLFSIVIILSALTCSAQFDGAGGESGSKSIKNDDGSITSWATGASIVRGKLQINQTNNSRATLGDSNSAIGPFDGNVISLGDSGVVTLSFDNTIQNKDGYDFAVFENGFKVGFSYYLELAHVEVSENGVDYVRFPSECLTDSTYQLDNFAYTKPEEIYNLAGKHQAPYGTLFDLEEVGLEEVNYIRIVDVIGSINDSFGSRDSEGRIINDPWPTPFASSGFDLDAVAVVNGTLLKRQEHVLEGVSIYPTFAQANEMINLIVPEGSVITVSDIQGRLVSDFSRHNPIFDKCGIYVISIQKENQIWQQKVVVY
jgi:hypothetical protein